MKTFRLLCAISFLLLNITLFSQENAEVMQFKKGQVLDFILAIQKPDTEDLWRDYTQKAIGLALSKTYERQPVFDITDHTSGCIAPELIVFGKWASKEIREQFLIDILTTVPDFHERRRAIFSMFYATYFEIKKDTTIRIDRSKYLVITSIWTDSKKRKKSFLKQWQQALQKHSGNDVLSLTGSISPKGYRYAPDQFIITEWENKADFELFKKEGLNIDNRMITEMQQFIIK